MTSFQQSPSQQNKVVDRQSSFESHVGVCAIRICRKQGPNHPMSYNLRLVPGEKALGRQRIYCGVSFGRSFSVSLIIDCRAVSGFEAVSMILPSKG